MTCVAHSLLMYAQHSTGWSTRRILASAEQLPAPVIVSHELRRQLCAIMTAAQRATMIYPWTGRVKWRPDIGFNRKQPSHLTAHWRTI